MHHPNTDIRIQPTTALMYIFNIHLIRGLNTIVFYFLSNKFLKNKFPHNTTLCRVKTLASTGIGLKTMCRVTRSYHVQ